jgi:hypothetical protein
MVEAERQGIEHDGGDEAAASFWHLRMAEELPFTAQQRPWERAAFIVAGTPLLPHDPATQVVIAGRLRSPVLPPRIPHSRPALARSAESRVGECRSSSDARSAPPRPGNTETPVLRYALWSISQGAT